MLTYESYNEMDNEKEEAREEKYVISTEASKELVTDEINDYNEGDIKRCKELEEVKEEEYLIVIEGNNECTNSEFNEITLPLEITETNIKQEIQSNFKKEDEEASLSNTSNVEPPNLGNIETNREHMDDNGEQRKPSSDKDKLSRKLYQCKVCNRTFKQQRCLYNHKKYVCGQEGQFPCNSCDYRAKTKYLLRRHCERKQECNGSMPKYKCDFCDQAYISKDNLTEHQKHHCDQEKRFRCNICNYSATRRWYLKKHCFNMHTSKKDKDKLSRKLYQCKVCNKTFKQQKGLYNHKKYVCGQGRQFPCNSCDYRAKTKYTLKKHCERKHKCSPSTDYCGQEGQFPCNICNFRAKTEDNLRRHCFRIHTAVVGNNENFNKYRCEVCNKTFTNKSSLNTHKKYICGKEGQFGCNICNYRAKQKWNLKAHIDNVHTDKNVPNIKKFKCEECEKVYKYKSGLTQHKKYDCGQEGQFVCYNCNHRAKRKTHIRLHIISCSNKYTVGNMVNTKKFKCEVCHKAYIHNSGLREHKKYDCGDQKRRFCCNICNYRANRKAHLKSHYANLHKLSGYEIDNLIEDTREGTEESEEEEEKKYTIVIETNDEPTASEFNEISFPMEITETNIKQEIKGSYYISDDKEASLQSPKNIELPNFGSIEIKQEPIDDNAETSGIKQW